MGLCELLRTCSDRSHLRFGRFLGIIRPVDFQQHSQKNQRAFSVTCPETNLQIKTAAESFFRTKSSIQFYFIISQTRIQQQAGIQDLHPNLNFCCLKNMYPCHASW
jgi:hypothetical protein